MTGSGKYFRNVILDPAANIAVIEIDGSGEKYRICWGLKDGGRPTSELPTHLMNHEVKKRLTKGRHRVIYHAHTTNVIALTFVLPLDDKIFTRELWESATECPVVFPDGVGVVPWMVPGGRDIAVATAKLMEKYDVAVWAHHGTFASGEDFDLTFGLMHTVEKAAEILVKIRSMAKTKLQSITADDFKKLAVEFGVTLPKNFYTNLNLGACFLWQTNLFSTKHLTTAPVQSAPFPKRSKAEALKKLLFVPTRISSNSALPAR